MSKVRVGPVATAGALPIAVATPGAVRATISFPGPILATVPLYRVAFPNPAAHAKLLVSTVTRRLAHRAERGGVVQGAPGGDAHAIGSV